MSSRIIGEVLHAGRVSRIDEQVYALYVRTEFLQYDSMSWDIRFALQSAQHVVPL
jgi:hypothetical protein